MPDWLGFFDAFLSTVNVSRAASSPDSSKSEEAEKIEEVVKKRTDEIVEKRLDEMEEKRAKSQKVQRQHRHRMKR